MKKLIHYSLAVLLAVTNTSCGKRELIYAVDNKGTCYEINTERSPHHRDWSVRPLTQEELQAFLELYDTTRAQLEWAQEKTNKQTND